MKIPKYLIPHLRTDHAGETGAVYIYIKEYYLLQKIMIL